MVVPWMGARASEAPAGWVAPAYGERIEGAVLRRRLDITTEQSEILLHSGDDTSQGQETQ